MALPNYLTRTEHYWNGTSDTKRWDLEYFIRQADNKHIVAYSDNKNKETIEICIGDSFAECETAMKKKLSSYKLINKNTLEDIRFQRPWFA